MGFLHIMKTNKKAQQLVEFALILPIIIIVLVVIVEFGYIINARISLSESVKLSMIKVNQLYSQPGDDTTKQAAIMTSIEDDLKTYFDDQGLPYSDSLAVTIERIPNSLTSIIRVNYVYKPFFSLANFFGSEIIPTEYTFTSTQVVNDVLLQANNLDSALSTTDLSSFGKTATNFDGRNSILKNQEFVIDAMNTLDLRKSVVFLVGIDTNDYTYARLINWYGEDLLPANLLVNIQTGTLFVKSPYYSVALFDTQIPYIWVLTSLGFSQAIYSKIDTNPDIPERRVMFQDEDITFNLGIPWCSQQSCVSCGDCADDMTDINLDNLNKRGISMLLDSNNPSYGAMEKIKVVTGNTRPETIFNHNFIRSNYVLRLYVPNATKPVDADNGFKFDFEIDATGVLMAGGGTPVDIVDVIMDNDNDNIPNAWDNDPEYMDVDGNGIIDGNETVNIDPAMVEYGLPEHADASTLAIGAVVASATPDCSGTPSQYTVTANEPAADPLTGAAPYEIYYTGPFDFAGMPNTINPANTYIPPTQKVALVDISFSKVGSEMVAGVCTAVNKNIGPFKYITYDNAGVLFVIRRFATWDTDPAIAITQKVEFINGVEAAGTIDLDDSPELKVLEASLFSATNKVQ